MLGWLGCDLLRGLFLIAILTRPSPNFYPLGSRVGTSLSALVRKARGGVSARDGMGVVKRIAACGRTTRFGMI